MMTRRKNVMHRSLMPSPLRLAMLMTALLGQTLLTACMPRVVEELQAGDGAECQRLLTGHWVSREHPTEHWVYRADSTGVFWDTAELSRKEAEEGVGRFRFHVGRNGLMRSFWMSLGGQYSNPDEECPLIIDAIDDHTMTCHRAGLQQRQVFDRQTGVR